MWTQSLLTQYRQGAERSGATGVWTLRERFGWNILDSDVCGTLNVEIAKESTALVFGYW